MPFNFPYEVKIGIMHHFFAEQDWANVKTGIIATITEKFFYEVLYTEEVGRISSHFYLLMAAVSSRCSHTKAKNGLPIGADGIRIIDGTA